VAGAKSRGQKSERTDAREALIDATLEVILTRGIDAVKIDEITLAVGVSKGAIYWHFEDRADLIRQSLREHLRRMIAEHVAGINEAIETATSKDDYLLQISRHLANPYDADEVELRWQKLELLAASRRDEEMAGLMRDLQRRSLSLYVDINRSAQERGILRPDVDPVAVAVALNAMALGSNLISVLDGEGPNPQAWTELMLFFVSALFPSLDSPPKGGKKPGKRVPKA